MKRVEKDMQRIMRAVLAKDGLTALELYNTQIGSVQNMQRAVNLLVMLGKLRKEACGKLPTQYRLYLKP